MDIASQKIIIKNTKHFFKYQYDYYSSLANEANTIKGMKFSSTTVDSSPLQDAKEKMYLRIMDAQKIMKSVDDAINSCQNDSEHPYATVLTLRYIKLKSTVYVINNIAFERTSYFDRVLPCALIEFANKFMVKELVNGVENIIDLTTASTGV
ncbi:hypothetical protein CYJ79_10910 [Lactobacillus crispatus]|uniref:Uncharacterized protein n=1 Tax=Lactobacillus crispatus TaxID=47770 RepID=A0A2N5KVX8_9LACO|nr:hypothetical protein [Lactobacillus crispatus]PLT10401.1 hypothetical protein CYJ79_10910 [Lactobacillus crispatus]